MPSRFDTAQAMITHTHRAKSICSLNSLCLMMAFSLFVGCDDEPSSENADMMQTESDATVGGVELDMMSQPDADIREDAEVGGDPNDMLLSDMELPDMELPDMELPDMELGPPACQNGLDDDQDGLTDYPRDPGCFAAEDNDELDPEFFECEDGIDNDGDGEIDLEDPGCSREDDPSELSVCGPHEAIDISDRRSVVSDSEGEPAYFEACRSNNAPEQTFVFTLRRPVEYLYFSTEGSSFDTLLSVRRECEDLSSEVACNDDVGSMSQTYSAVQLDQPALGDYYLIVDGYGESAGRVVLSVEAGVAEGEPCPPSDGALICPRGQACNDEGLCAPAACSDQEDNDQDDRSDYPSDPGCDRPEDQDETDPELLPECGDGQDNDSDGAIDFPNDPQCIAASDPREGADPVCDDGLDNDNDGLFDFPSDPGCDDPSDQNEFNPPACDDGRDNDGDGAIDFPNDPGCLNEDDQSERTPRDLPQCADGIDNDEDGLVDFPEDELSCQFAADSTEDNPCERREFREVTGLTSARGTQDGEDNDFSGTCGGEELGESLLVWRVSEDRALESLKVTSRNSEALVALYAKDRCETTEEIACSTTTSTRALELGPRSAGEDLYLFVDARFFSGIWRLQFDATLAEGARCDSSGIPGERWTCAEGLSCVEEISGRSLCIRPQCNDGQDNDGDGRIDYPNDPGCSSEETNSELDPDPLPACANDIDEDRDGLFDFGEDPDCSSAADQYEGPDCGDGIDNDGDGRTDINDPQCVCANDPSESSLERACSDQCDNDGDGLVDAEDPGCTGPEDHDEFNELQCRDGIDNDEDGREDYPDDPGCTSPVDNDETTPDPAPECGDDIDNDGDGLIDFRFDDGCVSASDNSEAGTCDLEPLTIDDQGLAQGDTSSRDGSQVGSCGFGLAPEAVYLLSLPHPVNLTLSTAGSDFNTVLYARRACRAQQSCEEGGDQDCVPGPTELGCNQDGPNDTTSELTLQASGDLFIFVDGLGSQSGSYQLSVRGEYPVDGACDPAGPRFINCPIGTLCLELEPQTSPSTWTCR